MTDPVPDSRISTLLEADVESAQTLVVEAGWNQAHADWELLRELGHVFKVAGPDGAVLATAATLPHAGGFGWISMVLVRQAARRRGIASQLLDACIGRLRAAGLASLLDATPAGRAVYGRIGFVDGWAITRWRRVQAAPAPDARVATGVRPMVDADWPAVRSLDAAAFGCDRTEILARLYRRSAGFACVIESGSGLGGFLLGRDGRLATQLGPLVATDEAAALALLCHATDRVPGPLLVDVLDRHAGVAAALKDRGFAIERPYTRMTLDQAVPCGDSALMVAIAGPELG